MSCDHTPSLEMPEKEISLIGGYQVVDKYLKSRKGRALDEINSLAQCSTTLPLPPD